MNEYDQLFERFRSDGDIAALGELFDRAAPALLRVAMHLARDPAGAEDLLQSTFLRAIEVRNEWDRQRSVLPWLFGILHNRARHARRRNERSPDPSRLTKSVPSDPALTAEHAEFDAAVDSAIAELPPTYRSVLRLHLAYGHAPAEIAHALELPPGTVRSQLARGLEKLRALLPLGFAGAAAVTVSGGRGLAAVKSAVLSHATATVPCALTGITTGGVALMKTKTMLSIAAVAVLGAGIWVTFPPTPEPAKTVDTAGTEPELLTPKSPSSSSPVMPTAEIEPNRVAVSQPTDPTTGSLRLACRWKDDGTEAAGVLVTVMPLGSPEGNLLQRSAATDEHGTVLFDGLPAGNVRFAADRGGRRLAEIVVGETTDADFIIPSGVDIRGRVVDEHGTPVSTARLWLSIGANNYYYGRKVTPVDSAGRFILRSVEPGRFLSADAPGYRAAVVQPVRGQVGSEIEVELVLRGVGASLVGTVLDADRNVVAGARVLVGDARDRRFGWGPKRHAEFRPAQILATDEHGAFVVDGLEPGSEVSVWVRGIGLCAWTQRVALRELGETSLLVQLERGGAVEGRITDGAGEPVARAYVTYRPSLGVSQRQEFHDFDGPDWAYNTVASDDDGRYHIEHVPPGTVWLLSGANRVEARGQVIAADGSRAIWDPVLIDSVILGRVVAEGGAALEGVSIICRPPRGSGRTASMTTDADGRFRSRPLAAAPYVLSFYAPDDGLRARPAAKLWGILPGSEEVTVLIPDEARPSSSISGTLLDIDGRPVAAGQVCCSAEGLYWDPTGAVDPLTGRFSIGPLTPGTYRLQTSIGDPPRDSAWSEPMVLLRGEALDVGQLREEEPGAIAVSVTGPDGEPVHGARVALEYATGWSAVLGRVTETETGKATIEDVAPGSYRVKVFGRDLPSVHAPVAVVAGEKSEVSLRIPASVECALVLSPPSEAVPIHLSLIWSRDGVLHEHWNNTWEAAGENKLTMHLASGAWNVVITSETGERAVTDFRVDLDDPPGREIQIRLP